MTETLTEKIDNEIKRRFCEPKNLPSGEGVFCIICNCYCDTKDKRCHNEQAYYHYGSIRNIGGKS